MKNLQGENCEDDIKNVMKQKQCYLVNVKTSQFCEPQMSTNCDGYIELSTTPSARFVYTPFYIKRPTVLKKLLVKKKIKNQL